MRLLMLLCTVYLLLLGFVPCADGGDAWQTPAPASANASHEHDEETCTPLCVCGCCSITITVASQQTAVENTIYQSVPDALLPALSIALLHRAGNTVWQPPRA